MIWEQLFRINGGAILFLKPPNTRININLPMLGTFATEIQPNKGIESDIPLSRTVADVVTGVDVVLKKALEVIGKE